MARYLYGGGGDGGIVKPDGTPYSNATALVYNARTGGSQVMDLQTVGGASVTQVVSDAQGQLAFYGPDDYTGVLWVDFGSGVRWALAPKDVDQAALRQIAVQRAADLSTATETAKAKLTTNASDPLLHQLAADLDPLVIPRFASQGGRDAAFPSPAEGDRCFRTDLHADQVYADGAWRTIGLGAWTDGTFSIVPASGSFSIGSGSLGIRYRIDGKSVTFYLWATWGADTSFGIGTWTFQDLPFAWAPQAVNVCYVTGNALTQAGRFPVFGQLTGTNRITPYAPTSTSNTKLEQIGASPTPGGGPWQAANYIRLSGITEIA